MTKKEEKKSPKQKTETPDNKVNNSNAIMEKIKLLHLQFSDTLKREDEKSERFALLIATLLTAVIISLSFLYDPKFLSPSNNQLNGFILLFSILVGSTYFLFISLLFSVTSFFDITYEKEGVDHPFRWLARLIGWLILNLSKKEAQMIVAIRDEGISVSDRLYHKVLSKKIEKVNNKKRRKYLEIVKSRINQYFKFDENESKDILMDELKLDIAWKAYLIHSRWKIRKWGLIFLGWAVVGQTVSTPLLIYIQYVLNSPYGFPFVSVHVAWIIYSILLQSFGISIVLIFFAYLKNKQKKSKGKAENSFS